jgi:hypothetical protein
LLAAFGLLLEFVGRSARMGAGESLLQDASRLTPNAELHLECLGKKGGGKKGKDDTESSDDEDAAYDCKIQIDEEEPESEARVIMELRCAPSNTDIEAKWLSLFPECALGSFPTPLEVAGGEEQPRDRALAS